MDLSKLSDADLQALSSGNMGAVSDAGLAVLAAAPAQAVGKDQFRGPHGVVTRPAGMSEKDWAVLTGRAKYQPPSPLQRARLAGRSAGIDQGNWSLLAAPGRGILQANQGLLQAVLPEQLASKAGVGRADVDATRTYVAGLREGSGSPALNTIGELGGQTVGETLMLLSGGRAVETAAALPRAPAFLKSTIDALGKSRAAAATAGGVAAGTMQPVGTGESRSANAALGGATGVLGDSAMRAVPYVGRVIGRNVRNIRAALGSESAAKAIAEQNLDDYLVRRGFDTEVPTQQYTPQGFAPELTAAEAFQDPTLASLENIARGSNSSSWKVRDANRARARVDHLSDNVADAATVESLQSDLNAHNATAPYHTARELEAGQVNQMYDDLLTRWGSRMQQAGISGTSNEVLLSEFAKTVAAQKARYTRIAEEQGVREANLWAAENTRMLEKDLRAKVDKFTMGPEFRQLMINPADSPLVDLHNAFEAMVSGNKAPVQLAQPRASMQTIVDRASAASELAGRGELDVPAYRRDMEALLNPQHTPTPLGRPDSGPWRGWAATAEDLNTQLRQAKQERKLWDRFYPLDGVTKRPAELGGAPVMSNADAVMMARLVNNDKVRPQAAQAVKDLSHDIDATEWVHKQGVGGAAELMDQFHGLLPGSGLERFLPHNWTRAVGNKAGRGALPSVLEPIVASPEAMEAYLAGLRGRRNSSPVWQLGDPSSYWTHVAVPKSAARQGAANAEANTLLRLLEPDSKED